MTFGLRWLLIFVLLLELPIAAVGATKQAPIRTRWPFNNAFKISTRKQEQLKSTALDTLVVLLRGIQTKKDFYDEVLPKLKPNDRADMIRLTSGLDRFPEVARIGDELHLTYKGETLRIAWPNPYSAMFKINGVPWIYSPKQPLAWQIGLLAKKLDHASSNGKSVLLKLILEDAHAAGPVFLLLLGAGVSAVVTLLVNRVDPWMEDSYCHDLTDGGTKLVTTGPCGPWSKNYRDKLMVGSPTYDSVSNFYAADGEPLTNNWEIDDENGFQCPVVEKDKIERIAQVRIRRIRWEGEGENERMVPLAPASDPHQGWMRLRVKLFANNSPQEGVLVRDNVDPSSPQAKANAIHVYKFNEVGTLLSTTVHDPKADLASNPMAGDRPPLSRLNPPTDPNLQRELMNAEELIKVSKGLSGYCMWLLGLGRQRSRRQSTPSLAPPANAQLPVGGDATAVSPMPARVPNAPADPPNLRLRETVELVVHHGPAATRN